MGSNSDDNIPFGIYILDFYCHQLSLAIEVDGPVHEHQESKRSDVQRQMQLEQAGLQLIRFRNIEIETRLEDVILQMQSLIKQITEKRRNSTTYLPPSGGQGAYACAVGPPKLIGICTSSRSLIVPLADS